MKSISKKILFLGMVSAVLVGCTTHEDELARYRQTCLSYGFEYGSDAFSKCMLEQERMDRKDQRYQEKLLHKRQWDYPGAIDYRYTRPSAYSSNRPSIQNSSIFNSTAYSSAPSYDSSLRYRGETLSQRQKREPSGLELKLKAADQAARTRAQAARAEQIRNDEILARKLQAEEARKAAQIRNDEALARKLQAEEDRKAAQIRNDEALARKLQAEENAKAGIQ
jgi:hypothetical protein